MERRREGGRGGSSDGEMESGREKWNEGGKDRETNVEVDGERGETRVEGLKCDLIMNDQIIARYRERK